MIDETPSDSGDYCHRDIKNITPKESEKTFKDNASFPSSFQICHSCGGLRTLTKDDLETDVSGF